MYKLVAIDLDGTLLDSYGNISQKNKSVIEAVKRKGTKVIIASGRNKTSALSFSKDINSSEYVICNNGATLYDIKNNKNIYNQYIDKKKALDIIKICDENSIFYSIYTEDFVIANTMNYNVLFFESENGKTLEEQRTNIKIIKDVYSYIKENENVNVLKMNICDNNKIIFDRIISKLKNIKEVNVLDVEHMTKKIIKTGTEEVTIEYGVKKVGGYAFRGCSSLTSIEFPDSVVQINGGALENCENLENVKLSNEKLGTLLCCSTNFSICFISLSYISIFFPFNLSVK